jgi:glycosyltransferase involved in cell wall biosynthesis
VSLCFVIPYKVLESSGDFWLEPRYPIELIKYPAAFFRSVTVVAPTESIANVPAGAHKLAAICPDIRVVRLPKRGRAIFNLGHDLIGVVRSSEVVATFLPDIPGTLAIFLARILGKPSLLMMIGDWEAAIRFNYRPSFSRMWKMFTARYLSRLAVSCATATMAQGTRLFFRLRKISPRVVASTVHSPLTEAMYQRCDRNFGPLPTVLSVGGLVPLKRHTDLAHAIKRLKEKGHAVRWICAGDGPEYGPLTALVRDLGLARDVIFVGHLTGRSLLDLYRSANLFVHCSATEGLPNAVLEAMANSLPVVAADVGSMSDVVVNGVSGLLVPPFDVDALATAIDRLLTDVNLRTRLSMNAYSMAVGYACDTLGAKMLGIIQQHLNLRSPLCNWREIEAPVQNG